LHDKFRKFSSNSLLTDSLPPDSEIKNPGIIDSSETIEEGDICIDNIHRAYEHVSSSIDHSLRGNGGKTLVINDEAHHLINPKRHAGTSEKKDMLEWENFLKNPDYGFYYILNSSGTPYKGNNYFKDVIYRYGIRRAIEDEFVKDINYLEKDESKNWSERLKAVLNNHAENKEKYPEAKKHITIFVTDRIEKTDKIAKKIRDFLQEEGDLSREEVEKLVISVTSSSKHEENRRKLEVVDEPESPVEWIVSVSMLTEGWDVDNVF
jgi:type III restriction enzyme